MVALKSSLSYNDLVNRYGISQMTKGMLLLSKSQSGRFPIHRVCNQSSTSGSISGAGTAYHSYLCASPLFRGVRDTQSFVFCVAFIDNCLSVCPLSVGHCVVCPFVLFLLAIVLSVLRCMASDYPFGIFKLFLQNNLATGVAPYPEILCYWKVLQICCLFYLQ